ncbi:hypothetical protein H6G89_15655 [Oscillatoria sp. FACHB-1407]|uniref:hypothetical protein n=1 Tax=Oscillatoria sp. FACHB-1407 TaxID=2692847 RepID=UPI001683D54F|nr:hypothetical protein [Oscillatoria sp. FACHB-1407]MBD2462481.1 hypothetical protein [Oscillatoria sp. FACHB-1407]
MESFLLIASIILLVTTGFYAWFTYNILKELRQENNLYRNLIEKQLRLSTVPHIHCDMKPDFQANNVKLELYNLGNVPAYDLQVCVIGAYTEENMDIPTFMRTFIQPRFRKYPLQVDKVGYYGIRSSMRHPLLPFQQRLALPLNLPAPPVDVYALLQYREISGGNYYQVYCFSDLDEQGNYKANILEPSKQEPLERFHFYDTDDINLATNEKVLPYHVRDFIDLWNHSLSYRLTIFFAGETTNPQEASGT